MTEQEILEVYERQNAVWFFDYNGDPKAPHAELTSGLCSDGYVNSAPVLADPHLVALLAFELVNRLGQQRKMAVSWVVGSAYAAITFSYQVARGLGAMHGFVEKDPANSKRMIWNRLTIPEGRPVLQCEELITTLGTTIEVRRAIQEGNPYPVAFLPCVATAVYRPLKLDDELIKIDSEEIKVVSLISKEVKTWQPAECPLCRQGSSRLRPKHNWARLTGKLIRPV